MSTVLESAMEPRGVQESANCAPANRASAPTPEQSLRASGRDVRQLVYWERPWSELDAA